jgi:predicted ATPase/class 3 adenylate cyclase
VEIVRPSGAVTFLFTDVEGSTRLWEQHDELMDVALAAHDEIIRSGIDGAGGYVFSTAGDAFAAAFESVGSACDAALEVQDRLVAHAWPTPEPIRVRMGLHVGVAHERGGDFFGPTVNRAARIMAAANGGQVVLSEACASEVGTDDLADLGEHRLKDLSVPERLWQLNPGSFPPLRTLDVARHNLPVERTPLLGRADDIDRIVELATHHRLVTLLGIGGAGKTRLATAVAAELVDGAPDGVWVVDLVPAATFADVVTAIASAAGLTVTGTDLVGSLADALRVRRTVIVLDNCEHVADQVAEVVDVLLASTVNVHFLATSREPLDLGDEQQVRVEPLAISEDSTSPAIELFASSAERVGVTVVEGDAPLVARVCRSLDGLPLAIELAAAQLRQMDITELAERLHHRFELLTRRRGGRQASLLTVVDDSWQMLDPPEQDLLLQLAAFPASFGIDDVEAVCRGRSHYPARLLGGLVDRGLVSGDDDGRHRLLETIKLYAREQWATRADPQSYLDNHRRWVLDELRRRSPEEWYTSADVVRWGIRHYDDHRAVEDHLAAEGATDELALLLAGLTYTYHSEYSSRAAAAIERFDRYLATQTFTGEQRAGLHLVTAGACLQARQPLKMAESLSVAKELFEGHGAPKGASYAQVFLATVAGVRDTDTALELIDDAARTAEQAEAPAIAELALAFKAAILAMGGTIAQATRQLDDLRPRLERRSAHDYARQCHDLVDLGVNVVRKPHASRAAAQQVAAYIDDIEGSRPSYWPMLAVICTAYAACADVPTTGKLIAQAEESATVSGDQPLPDLLVPLAALAWALDDHHRARRLLTAVRRSPIMTHGFYITIAYRQLRDEIGLLDKTHSESATIEEIREEAVKWLRSVDQHAP